MRFGIPLLGDRIAPRCTFADSVLLVTTKRRRIQEQAIVPLEGNTWADLATLLVEHEVDTLVCGGISQSTSESIRARNVDVIDNVAGTSEEILEALRKERIHPGFGLDSDLADEDGDGGNRLGQALETPHEEVPRGETLLQVGGAGRLLNCLECQERVCFQGQPCPFVSLPPPHAYTEETRGVLEAAWDVALEKERTLCRLAEVAYFALELGCRRVGVAYCVDLQEPAAIVTGVFQRFFEVVPVCCRVGGILTPGGGIKRDGSSDGESGCDPCGMAAVLNASHTDLNVLMGLCVGADCLFNRESKAMVTTLFVKDKSLANNPIGAVYSHYYLKDI